MTSHFPFSAVVCSDRIRHAVYCGLISDEVRTILIRGAVGTGKSCLADSVASISGRKVVRVPAGATEDAVFGGMDMESALEDGRRVLSECILKRADGNLLVAENVDRLSEPLLLEILNSVITGNAVVERGGITAEYGVDTLFIGTMDASSTVSEHILDRFDICVTMEDADDEETAMRIVDNHMDVESGDTSGFDEADSEIRAMLSSLKGSDMYVTVPDGYCGAIADVCTMMNVSGHRGDVAMMSVSCALAALRGAETASMDDLKEAASLCLEHRRRPDSDQRPQEPPPQQDGDDGQEDEHDDDVPPDPPEDGDGSDPPEDGDDGDAPDESASQAPPVPHQDLKEQVFAIGRMFDSVELINGDGRRTAGTRAGRHTVRRSEDGTGRCVGSRIPKGRVTDIALTASIIAAAPYQRNRSRPGVAVVIEKQDLREKVREKRQGERILFLVDGSGSMGASKRMVAVKGAVMSMLRKAYQKRDEIGLTVFRGQGAEEILPMTQSVLDAHVRLAKVPTGGRTPLTHGLLSGYRTLKPYITPECRPTMVIFTDGRVNVPLTPGSNPSKDLDDTARMMADCGIRFIIVDTECGRLRLRRAERLSEMLKGTMLKLDELDSGTIERSVKRAIGACRDDGTV